MQNILFSIENQKFAFALGYVDRVVLAVETTPLPHAPTYVLGAINIQGKVVPLINLREVLGFPSREMELSDQFLICHINDKNYGFWIDAVMGVVDYPQEALIPAHEILPDLDSVDYVVKEKEEIVLVYNLEKLLWEAKNGCQSINL